jgi:hypothetical protein
MLLSLTSVKQTLPRPIQDRLPTEGIESTQEVAAAVAAGNIPDTTVQPNSKNVGREKTPGSTE